MSRFSATNESEALVPAERMAIWAVLTDPELLPRLTPMLQRIDTDGDVWRWEMRRIGALGVSVRPCFTERMTFDEGRRIDYVHEPPKGKVERTGADGWYVLDDHEDGTRLRIKLTLTVELPLPKAAGGAVRRVMESQMSRTGDKFAVNLLRHLGVDRPTRR